MIRLCADQLLTREKYIMLLDEVLGKGVESVPHDGVDYFYRCLLRLRADQLEAVLRVGEATDDFYRKNLRLGCLGLQLMASERRQLLPTVRQCR